VTLGSFAFARDSSSSHEKGYIKNLKHLKLKEREETVLREITLRNNPQGNLVPDYTSFIMWVEKLRKLAAKDSKALLK
jgi:hypothetical protein